MQVALVMFKSDGAKREFPIKPDGFVIGRKNNCDLRIPLSSVSRQHCLIRVDAGKVQLKDTGSSNGTYHNGIRVTEAVLAAGDEVVIGPVVFTVVIDGKPDKIEPVRTLVDAAKDEDDDGSVILPADLLAEVGDGDGSSINDTIHELGDDDDEDDPLIALDRLAEIELPDSDAKG